MSYVGSNVEQLLAALTDLVGAMSYLGLGADADHGTAARLTWVAPEEGHLSFRPPRVQPEDGVVIHDELALFNVSITGPTAAAVEQLRDRLIAGLEDLLGPLEYALGSARKARGGELDHAAFGVVLPVTLIRPVYGERYTEFTLEGSDLTGIVEIESQQQELVSDEQ